MATVLNTCSSSLTQTRSNASSTSHNFYGFSSAAFHRHDHIRKLSREEPKPLSASAIFRHSAIHCSRSTAFLPLVGISPVFQEIGLNERETEYLLRENQALAQASPKSIRDQCISLQSVGISGFALCNLIIKRPEILTMEETDKFLEFVQENLKGIETAKLQRLLILAEPQVIAGFADKVRLLLDHGVPHERLVHVLQKVNFKTFFCDKKFEENEIAIIFLKRYGIDVILRRPILLNLDLKTQIIPRIRVFTELSGDEKATEILVRKFPSILSNTVKHIQIHTEFWRWVGLSDKEIFKIVQVYPSIFSASKERKLHPRIEFLKQCGLNSNDIFKFLIKSPLFLSLSFRENVLKKLAFLIKLGYEDRTKEFAFAAGAVTRTSSENLQMVIGVLLSYGFSSEDILAMSKKHPQILQYNHKSLVKKMEYLIEEMGREIGELLAFPAYLGYKLDDRIKPRYEVKSKIIGKGLSLNKLLSVPTDKFLNKKNSVETMMVSFDLDVK